MTRYCLGLAIALIALPTTAIQAQVSLNVPGLSVNVPLPQAGPQCRKMRVDTPNGPRRERYCLGPDGQWYPQGAPMTAPPPPEGSYAAAPEASPEYSEAAANLTGEWRTPSGGYFEISQSGNHVTWEAHSADGYSWSNHFEGDIRGNLLTGYFYDHPSQHYHNSGELVFRLQGSTLIRINNTRAFADNMLIRSDAYAAGPAATSSRYGGYNSAAVAQDQETGHAPPQTQIVQEPDSPLARELDAVVREDSKHWGFNHYNYGSMRNAKVLSRAKDGTITYYGEYTFNQGEEGWVKVRMKKGKLICLAFHDDQECRPLGDSLSMRAMEQAMRSGGSGGGSGGSGDQGNFSGMTMEQYQDMQEQRQISQQQQQQQQQ